MSNKITCATVNKYTRPLFGVELCKHHGQDSMWWCVCENNTAPWAEKFTFESRTIYYPSADCLTVQEWIFDLVEKINAVR